MRARTVVGLLMVFAGPALLTVAVFLAPSVSREVAAYLFAVGIGASVWLGTVGYQVLRGRLTLSEIRGYLPRAVLTAVVALVATAWFLRPR